MRSLRLRRTGHQRTRNLLMRKVIGWSLTWELPAQQVGHTCLLFPLGREPLEQTCKAAGDTAIRIGTHCG